MSNLGGLSFEDDNSKKTIYVHLKPDGNMVQRIKGEEATTVLAMDDHERKINKYRTRVLEMGTNQGDLIVERVFKPIRNVQLIKIEEKDSFGVRTMVLTFNNMKDGSPNVCVETPLVNTYGSIGDYAGSFIDLVPNLEIGKFMTFESFMYVNKSNKEKKGINILQDSKEIESAFWNKKTKTEITDQGIKPNAVKTTKLGKEHWDFSDQAEFLIKIFNKFCIDIDKAFGNEITESKEANPKENSQVSQEADTVDLPF